MALESTQVMAVRRRLLTMHYRSKTGHIGGNLSSLDAMLLLHHDYLHAEDRFILSKGHAAGALYATLWSLGRLTDDDLDSFHRDGTHLPGHPPPMGLPDISFATGSLGHGLSLAAGLALSKKIKSAPGRVFCLTSDGEWEEGSTWEALIFAAHHRLDQLTVLIDHNGLQGFGTTDAVASMGAIETRLCGFDLAVRRCSGHDLAAMRAALDEPTDRPRVVVLDTVKGHGVSFMEGRMEWHYLPMSEAQYHQAMAEQETP